MWPRAARPRRGETRVVSTAAWAPCRRGSPFANTSMRQPSVKGTSTFTSYPVGRNWMPLVLQLRGKHTPLPSPTPPCALREHRQSGTLCGSHQRHRVHLHAQRHQRGPSGMHCRNRLSNCTRKQKLESRNPGAVGSAIREREPPGPALDSINAREAESGQKKTSCKRQRRKSSGAARCHPRSGSPKRSLSKRRRRALAMGKFFSRRQREPGILQLRRCLCYSQGLGCLVSAP